MKSQDIFPVLISVGVIVLVAILEKHSKQVAAITATMPLTAALALWIVYSSAGGDQGKVTEFSREMLLGIIPTLGFLAAVWVAARMGLKLSGMLVVGYSAWAVILGLSLFLRRIIG